MAKREKSGNGEEEEHDIDATLRDLIKNEQIDFSQVLPNIHLFINPINFDPN
jgi:hypothetical protein